MANKIELPFAATNSGIDTAILTGVKAVHAYANGVRTSDIPTATSVKVALHGNCFEPLNIKIDGTADVFPELTDEDIKAACAAMKPYMVKFKNCRVSLYTIDGQLRMTGVADGVELVNGK